MPIPPICTHQPVASITFSGSRRKTASDAVLAHRLLHLLDAGHAGASPTATRSSAALRPATTSSTCGSTARSSGAA